MRESQPPPEGTVQHLRPDGLHANPAYTNVVVTTGPVKTVYIGAQGALDAQGNLVGNGDIAVQAEQVMHNLYVAVTAAGAQVEHIIKCTVYLLQGQPLQPAYAAFQRFWGNRQNAPINTVIFVAALGPPAFLLLVEAIAVVPSPVDIVAAPQ